MAHNNCADTANATSYQRTERLQRRLGRYLDILLESFDGSFSAIASFAFDMFGAWAGGGAAASLISAIAWWGAEEKAGKLYISCV
jgi:hypothetical protein